MSLSSRDATDCACVVGMMNSDSFYSKKCSSLGDNMVVPGKKLQAASAWSKAVGFQ